MKITENQLRSLTRNIIKELFTRKNRLSMRGVTDYDIDPYDYSGDGDAFAEADEVSEIEELEETETMDELEETSCGS